MRSRDDGGGPGRFPRRDKAPPLPPTPSSYIAHENTACGDSGVHSSWGQHSETNAPLLQQLQPTRREWRVEWKVCDSFRTNIVARDEHVKQRRKKTIKRLLLHGTHSRDSASSSGELLSSNKSDSSPSNTQPTLSPDISVPGGVSIGQIGPMTDGGYSRGRAMLQCMCMITKMKAFSVTILTAAGQGCQTIRS